MDMAQLTAEQGTCSRAQVGVVIARDNRVLVTGYNGAPSGMPHCDHNCDCGYFSFAGMGDPDSFSHSTECTALKSCQTAVHAEANAIAFAAREGIRIAGADLYCTYSPCRKCAELIIASGIGRVFFEKFYRGGNDMDLLFDAETPVYRVIRGLAHVQYRQDN